MIPAPPGVSVVFPKSAFTTNVNPPLLKIGDRVKCGPSTKRTFQSILKKHNMVARMKGKKFEPIFVVTAASNIWVNNHLFECTLKPYNF